MSLANKTSSGYDGISNNFLKEIKDSILTALTKICNKSLSTGVFPDLMKVAYVTPLHKAKEKYLLDNYRPISVLITLSKILDEMYVQQGKWILGNE